MFARFFVMLVCVLLISGCTLKPAKEGNSSNAGLDLNRWVGHWESTTVYKPTPSAPDGQTIKGSVVVRKILDDQFLLWQWTSETGDPQYMALLAFNPHVRGYHIWLFGSGGEMYERIGQWDASSDTLKLFVKPPFPGVTGTSTDRFVDDDHIESTLLVKNAKGEVTRDMQATWVRKSDAVEQDITLSPGSADTPAELAVLQKMAGNWTVKQTMKPSVWFPDGKTETFSEQSEWAIGGRFLLQRGYNEQKQLNSFAFLTYEPREKSYLFRLFTKDVYGGQWSLSWDEAAKTFHWRATDMPAGWVGTGINRWIDNDTVEGQALIKDDQGRVLLDSQQERKRVESGTE